MSYKAEQLDLSRRGGSFLEVKGVRWFSLKELEKYTKHFSVANEIGSGGYGKVSFDCPLVVYLINVCLVKKNENCSYLSNLYCSLPLQFFFYFIFLCFLIKDSFRTFFLITQTIAVTEWSLNLLFVFIFTGLSRVSSYWAIDCH